MELTNLQDFNWASKTILIGEDELINYRLLEVMLSKTKVKLLHGKNGPQTLALFIENPQINLILMDIKMPEMDGCDVTKEIRKLNTEVPVIAQTAYAMAGEKEEILKSGSDAYLSKPLDKMVLLDTIHLLIH